MLTDTFYKILVFLKSVFSAALGLSLVQGSRHMALLWCCGYSFSSAICGLMDLYGIEAMGEEAEADIPGESRVKSDVSIPRSVSRKEIKDRVRIPKTMGIVPCLCGNIPELKYDQEHDGFYFICEKCHAATPPAFYLAEATLKWNDANRQGASP